MYKRQAFAGSGDPTGNYPTVMVSANDGDQIVNAILAASSLDPPVPVPITIASERAGEANFGSNWSTYLRAFKLGKCGKTLNAPNVKDRLPPVGSSSYVASRQVTSSAKSGFPDISTSRPELGFDTSN